LRAIVINTFPPISLSQKPLNWSGEEHKSDKPHPQDLCQRCIKLGYYCKESETVDAMLDRLTLDDIEDDDYGYALDYRTSEYYDYDIYDDVSEDESYRDNDYDDYNYTEYDDDDYNYPDY